MKLTIELNDHTLHSAIEAQLQKVVAQVTDQLIIKKVNEVVDTKMSRVKESDFQMAMTEAAEIAFDKVLGARNGNTWHREQKIRSFITDAAMTILKNAKS